MSYNSLLNKIDELRILVGDWEGQQPSQLEMDMALDRVKKIYELLRFSPLDEVQTIDDEQDQVDEESTSVTIDDSKAEDLVEESISVEPELESESIEEDIAGNDEEEEMILNIDTLKSANKERYDKILSLYCDLESQEPIVAPEQHEEPEVEEPCVELEEKREEPMIVETKEVEPSKPVVDVPITTSVASSNTELYKISSQLGINDRFLLANDLFGGDISALSESLKKLDEFTNLDDVMIYIAENYKWDGDSEGAKLLYTLLQNRFF